MNFSVFIHILSLWYPYLLTSIVSEIYSNYSTHDWSFISSAVFLFLISVFLIVLGIQTYRNRMRDIVKENTFYAAFTQTHPSILSRSHLLIFLVQRSLVVILLIVKESKSNWYNTSIFLGLEVAYWGYLIGVCPMSQIKFEYDPIHKTRVYQLLKAISILVFNNILGEVMVALLLCFQMYYRHSKDWESYTISIFFGIILSTIGALIFLSASRIFGLTIL